MVILTQYLCYILTQHWVTEITQIGVHLTPNYLECIQSFSAYFGLWILLSLLPYLVYYPTPFYFALVTWDMGLKLNIFINVIASLSPCVSAGSGTISGSGADHITGVFQCYCGRQRCWSFLEEGHIQGHLQAGQWGPRDF